MEDLSEILKGYEGKTFYSTMFGDVQLVKTNCVVKNFPIKVKSLKYNDSCYLTKYGQYSLEGECTLFPSQGQRDWDIWVKEMKLIFPKTWSGLVKQEKITDAGICIAMLHDESMKDLSGTDHNTPVEKAALALIKIYQLIEEWYGGNITNREWNDNQILKYGITVDEGKIVKSGHTIRKHPIAFHTIKAREEFLSYLENVQLVQDLYMI